MCVWGGGWLGGFKQGKGIKIPLPPCKHSNLQWNRSVLVILLVQVKGGKERQQKLRIQSSACHRHQINPPPGSLIQHPCDPVSPLPAFCGDSGATEPPLLWVPIVQQCGWEGSGTPAGIQTVNDWAYSSSVENTPVLSGIFSAVAGSGTCVTIGTLKGQVRFSTYESNDLRN